MTKQQEIEKWITDWFINRNPDIDVNVKEDFYHYGKIDSLGFFELINDLEKNYSFKFTEDDLKHSLFRTIKVMSHIISLRMKTNI